ncbi:MAG: methyl-accepting chemotaxis protein [Actinomycetota bacterium]
MRFFERDLRIKITAILLVFVFVSAAGTAAISYIFMYRIVRSDVEQSLEDSAGLTSDVVEVLLGRRDSRVTLLANQPTMRDPASSPQAKLAVLDLFITYWPIGQGAVFTNTAGGVVCGTGKLSSIGDASETAWFENAATARVTFTHVHAKSELVSAFFDPPVLAVSSPVRDASDQVFGYLVCFTSMSDIDVAVDAISVEQTGHGFIVDSTGMVVAGHMFDRGAKPSSADLERREALVVEMSTSDGTSTIRYGGKSYLVSYQRIGSTATEHPELRWSVGVAVPSSEAFEPVYMIAWVLFGLALIFSLSAGLVAVMLGRGISRPIDELVENAERVGSGDLTGEVAIRTRDQIGTLAAAFLRMRDYLRGTLSEAARDSDRMSMLAEEQSAAAQDVFANTEEIVESVVVMARNLEALTTKVRQMSEYVMMMPERVRSGEKVKDVVRLLEESEILAEVGASKAVEIAAAAQDQRAATRDLAAAARRLSELSAELKEMVQRFKV